MTTSSTKASETEGPPAPPADPADAVRKLLTEMGYDTSQIKFQAREEFVSYPGGGYTHRYTTVELPNGVKQDHTTDLMARFPAVTANEIRRVLENQHLTGNVNALNLG
jgi:hypothetical protein